MHKKNKTKIKVIVFDYDGTLRPLDLRAIYNAHLKIFEFLGIIPDESYESFKKYLYYKSIPEEFYKKEWREKSQEIFHGDYDRFVPLFPWAECVIKKLSKKYALAIFSNSADYAIKNQLGSLKNYFEIIIGCNYVNNMKPHPEGLIKIMDNLQIKPEEILLIGDTMTDFMAAKNARTKIGIVNWGIGDFYDLLREKPDFSFISPLELMYV